ncbi:MAG TPA: Zn-dependent exopeptidase M28 [Clostridiales bacterium]|nr:Zn-dependent exopeptidase M28 [Clostridiales bacterium]
MKYVRLIASADQNIRKNAIINSLAGIGVPYFIQEFEDASNIVVSQNPSSRRLVIGAHWDSVENSTGANDNAAGCSALLHVIEKLAGKTKKASILYSLTKRSRGTSAAKGISKRSAKKNIAAMVNLDLCGYGDNIAVYEKGNRGNEKFFGLIRRSTRPARRLAAFPSTKWRRPGIRAKRHT